MKIKTHIFPDKAALGKAAAADAASRINAAIASKGTARIIVATGASQFEFLESLTADTSIDWPRVELFHLDEYIGMTEDHPASFRRYIRERILNKVPIREYHLLAGEKDPASVAASVGAQLAKAPIDVAFAGIGENAHLAFNDPPANFETEEPFIIVTLDHACRQQQAGEGWFKTVADVPDKALTMTIRQILKAQSIICVVPDERKAKAVQASLKGEVTPNVPASILQTHRDVAVYLDQASASLL